MILWLIFLALLSLYIYRRYRHMTLLQRCGIPGPKPNLITGNFFEFGKASNVAKVSEYFAKYGPIVGYYIGARPIVQINDLELIRRVQIKDFSNFPDRQKANIKHGFSPNPRFAVNLISAQGAHWKQTRTILNPTFSAAKLKTMTPIIDNSIDILIDKIKQRSAEAKEFDIYQYFQLLTTDVITKCALGIDTNVQQNPEDEFLKAGKKVFDGPSRFLIAFTMLPELDFILYPVRRLIQMWKESQNRSPQVFLGKLVEAAIALRQGQGQKSIQNGSLKSSKAPKHDLLQLMLDAKVSDAEIQATKEANLTIDMHVEKDSVEDEVPNGTQANGKVPSQGVKALSLDEVISTAVIFYEAGFETTSTALGFVAHCLVKYPEVQEKVREEVQELFRTEGKFDYNTVNKLTYMQMVINETMRYYPPVTMFVTRNTLEDYHYGKITIPKGATVRVPVWQLHHNEAYWPEHNKFDPERFRDKSAIDNVAFQPFGNGPRNCIGMRFALYEMKLALSKLLFQYRLVPGPSNETDLKIDFKMITETPKNGVWVKAVPVN